MDIVQLQKWLKRNLFYDGEPDGIIGPKTREALRKAQEFLAKAKLYNVPVDGKYGKYTRDAIAAFEKGKRYFNKHGVSFNIYDQNSMNKAITALRNKGVKQVNMNGRLVNLGDSDVANQFSAIAKDIIAGVRSKALASESDRRAIKTATQIRNVVNTEKGSNGGRSSYNANDLNNLVMRYAYDKYHGTAVDDRQWGISYNYTPHKTSTGRFAIGLSIDASKYTPEQAAQIARGAGILNYTYGGKKYQTNLFAGSRYKNLNDFNAKLKAIQASSGLQAAQDVYNAEMRRQYNTYGIDHNMLKDKTGFQWNTLFGVVPYGYNGESMGAIANGEQAWQAENSDNTVNGLTTSNSGYRKTKEHPNGRFIYNNYDEWTQARVLANPKYHNGAGLSATRAVTSMYSMGFPVAKQVRGQLSYAGARPDATAIDRTNYYDITDKDRGTGKMQAWLYNEVSRNPEAAYKYFQYIYGDRRNGKVTTGRDRTFDDATASKLATAAGLTPYHLSTASSRGGAFRGESVVGMDAHDLWESLKDFYQNGYDESGKLRSSFKYSEQGYNHGFDGGSYVVFVKDGKAQNAQDDWNVGLGSIPVVGQIDGGLNAGINGRGIPHISRFRYGGMIDKYQEGGWLANPVTRLVDGVLWLADAAGMPSHVTNATRDVVVRANNVPIIAADTVWKRLSGQGKTWKEAWKEADTNPSTVARVFEYFPITNTETNYSEAQLADQYELRRHSPGRKGQITAEGYKHANQGRYAGDVGGIKEFFSPTKVNEWSIGQTSGQKGKDGKDYTTDVFAYDQDDTDKVYLKAVKEGKASPVMTLRGFLGLIGAQGYPDGTNSATSIKTKIDTDAQKKAWEKRKGKK